MTPPAEFRYRSLDHWRGVAALGVTVFHLYAMWSNAHEAAATRFPLIVIKHGWLGVQLFFVISGYCIAERIARQYRTGASLGSFLLDRAWRIFPVYWVAMALLLFVRLVSAPFNHAPAASTLSDWLIALPLVEPWLHRPSLLTVTWSLTCELFYYLLAGLCLVAARRARRPWLGFALAAGLGVAGLTIPALTGQVAWRLLPNFLLGVLVWGVIRGLSRPWRVPVGAIACAAIVWLSWLPGVLTAEGDFAMGVAGLFAFLLIVLQPWDEAIAHSRFLRPLAAVGVFSYSLYLVHVIITSPLQNLIRRALPYEADTFAVIPLLLTVVAIAFGWLFYRWVEKPLEALRHKYTRRPVSLPNR